MRRRRPVIVDANSVIMRAAMASALDDLKSGRTYTGGIYGALRTLRAIVASIEARPSRVVAFFDNGIPAERLRLIPEYKSERKARKSLVPEEDLDRVYAQVGRCYELWPLLGVQCLSYKNREADDGVAAAVQLLQDANRPPLVVSGDKDLWQVCWWGAHVWRLRESDVLTEQNFYEETGVPAHLWLLYRALVGDPSDSIPGVAGCGPARSARLMSDLPFSVEQGHLRHDEVAALVDHLRGKPKLRKFEQAVVDNEAHIRRVMLATDLERSFGSARGLRSRLLSPPKLRKREFLAACKELGFASIIGDPDRYIVPFQRASDS